MLIETQRDLITLSEGLRTAPYICIDTEFVSERRYYPDVGTIQIAAPSTKGEQSVLVDPLAVRDLSPLRHILTSASMVKVFHAPEQDLAIFFRLLGEPVRPVFDSQVAAALLGYSERPSFRDLVERVTGVRLEKGHTFTDWLRRPLAPSQVQYALDDVRHLMPVYERLVQELENKGQLQWAREEFKRYEKRSYRGPFRDLAS
jgi:ribonuclease D